MQLYWIFLFPQHWIVHPIEKKKKPKNKINTTICISRWSQEDNPVIHWHKTDSIVADPTRLPCFNQRYKVFTQYLARYHWPELFTGSVSNHWRVIPWQQTYELYRQKKTILQRQYQPLFANSLLHKQPKCYCVQITPAV